MNVVEKVVSGLFGNKSDRDIKEVSPYVSKTKEVFSQLSGISDDELRARSGQIRQRIQDKLQDIDQQIAELKEQVQQEDDIFQKDTLFSQLDALEKDRDTELEKVLLEELPEAFAVVKETARRLSENKKLVVKATDRDRAYADKHDHVSVAADTITWYNKWQAAGTEVEWNMVHYDVQLIGGVVLHTGKVAEMATGEGKTLVATLPTFLNALAGRGVHIVTVNDYLARRDAAWMGPLLEFHHISVDCIDLHRPMSPERQAAYQADVTYGTNNEFGFDYLRDNGVTHPSQLVQKKHHYAIIDEVDSVLIDEARTPLIISGPIPKGDEHEFQELKPRIQGLVDKQRKLVHELLQEAKKKHAAGQEKEMGLPLYRAFRALPKHKPLIKFLSEPGVRQIMNKTEAIYLENNQKRMPEADEPLFFTIEEKTNTVDLTDQGITEITKSGEDPQFFILPDIGEEVAKMESDSTLSAETQRERKQSLMQNYTVKAKRIHTVNQLLKAYALFEKDSEYIVVDNKVKIVDEQTGRVMDGRRYSDGLHQAIEAKENVKIEDATQTYSTVTLQNYFRMYHKLSGMTGTAVTEAGELLDIYKLDVVVIPTNRPIQRDDRNDKVFRTMREKFNAVAEEIVELSNAGRPVLVGTTSVEVSELVSRMLNLRKIKHNVLNAKQHQREAEVVAEAGKPGTVTIATNMAGRGTDIKLAPASKEAGGLAIIGTERHDSRRVDRQLRGRSGRQGDPGSSQFYVSLEDNLMRMFQTERVTKIMDRLGLPEGEVIQHGMVTKSIERAQKKVEENNFGMRKRLLEYDDVMNHQRELVYKRRRNALFGERLDYDIMNMFYDTAEDMVNSAKASDDLEGLKLSALSTLGIELKLEEGEFKKLNNEQLASKIYEHAFEAYKSKNEDMRSRVYPVLENIKKTKGEQIRNVLFTFTDGVKSLNVPINLEEALDREGKSVVTSMEKGINLTMIDQAWREHLREMDDLKTSVQNASIEQKDPLVVYKFESFELFQSFLAKVNEEITSFLVKAQIPSQDPSKVQEARTQQRQNQRTVESKASVGGVAASGAGRPSGPGTNRPPVQKVDPAKSEKIFGRNDRVNVRYKDGTEKRDVKFKTVENDIKSQECVIID